MSTPFPHESIQRLSERVLSGEAVFFVGAGFSIDSEGNTAQRLIRRLVIRLSAMLWIAAKHNIPGGHDVRKDFLATFKVFEKWMQAIEVQTPIPTPTTKEAYEGIRQLAEAYYEVNDWMCSGFHRLLIAIHTKGRGAVVHYLLQEVHQSEEQFRKDWSEKVGSSFPIDPVPFQPISTDLVQFAWNQKDRSDCSAGKALFLDTMGFNNCYDIMGGKPKESLAEVEQSYEGLLHDRHWILSRFAREGWSPLLVTTNFDRLLEGAFRLSGFRNRPEKGSLNGEAPPPVWVPYWTRVSSPVEFFSHGSAHQSSQVVKLHGCSEGYADRRSELFHVDPLKQAASERYLRSMVFTFREIQNWREDSWSRDFLRTLLRTKTMVFCAYSTQDPVIHDTLRSVYEEMGREQQWQSSGQTPSLEDHDATAFYFASDDQGGRQFHGSEVLRASTQAATGKVASAHVEHPNYLRYQFKGSDAFPDLDDHFLWLNHLAVRSFQLQCLKSDLGSFVGLLTGRPPREQHVLEVIDQFKSLLKSEQDKAEKWQMDQDGKQEGGKHRHELRQLSQWTYEWHPSLMREMACVEAARLQGATQSGGIHSSWLSEMRLSREYYYPMSAQPGWTAWGAVVELALRKLVGVAYGRDGEIEAGPALAPTVYYRRPSQATWRAMMIVVPSQGIFASRPKPDGVFQDLIYWELDIQGRHAWTTRNGGDDHEDDKMHHLQHAWMRKAPEASLLWEWLTQDITKEQAEVLLNPSLKHETARA